ncbi:MAG: mechanosensitive ion channel domain-containing protein [Thermoleophilia bacterium]
MQLAPLTIFGLSGWPARLVWVGIIIGVAALLLWLIAWAIPRWSRRMGSDDDARQRQRQTALTALATGLRYLVLVAAAIAIITALAGGGGFAAIGGSALVVVLVGFASQRLLVDIIAGFFILFEDQYGVGDTIRLEPSGYTGAVVSVGLRTTVLGGPNGERMIVPNGVITGVRTIPGAQRPLRMEILTRDPDRVHAIVYELSASLAGAGGPWRSPPRIVRREGEDDITRIIAVVDCDAAREEAVTWLADAVATRAGHLLVAPPLVGVQPD